MKIERRIPPPKKTPPASPCLPYPCPAHPSSAEPDRDDEAIRHPHAAVFPHQETLKSIRVKPARTLHDAARSLYHCGVDARSALPSIRSVAMHATPPHQPIRSDAAAEPVGAYPHARRVGNLLFLSGVGPRTRGSKDIPGVVLHPDGSMKTYEIEPQVRACLQNVRLVLEEAGSSWDHIVDVTSFLTDMQRDFPGYNRLWAEYFPPGPNQPTRTTVQVGALPTAGNAPIAFEVKVIAAFPG